MDEGHPTGYIKSHNMLVASVRFIFDLGTHYCYDHHHSRPDYMNTSPLCLCMWHFIHVLCVLRYSLHHFWKFSREIIKQKIMCNVNADENIFKVLYRCIANCRLNPQLCYFLNRWIKMWTAVKYDSTVCVVKSFTIHIDSLVYL